MAPKKSKPNGFVLFAQDLMKNRKLSSLKEACDAAAPLWRNLNKEDKGKYDNQAKALRNEGGKMTSEGLDVELLVREQKEKAKAEECAKQDIRVLVMRAHMQGNGLGVEPFFLIHINLFCYHSPTDRYYPAEIGVVRFNLKDGVRPENTFHALIEPGVLPVGYKFAAKQHADETHLLKVPLDQEAPDNQEEVYFNLKTFLQKKKPKHVKSMPTLYAEEKYIPMIQNILDTWAGVYEDERNLFKVLSIQVLFYHLRNTAGDSKIWPTVNIAHRELEKDVYAYTSNIACEYHSHTPKPNTCSKSTVQRYVYMICDNCCADLGIDLEAGSHVPEESAIPESTSTCDDISSSASSQFGDWRLESDIETDSFTGSFDTASIVSDTASTSTLTEIDNDFPALGASAKPKSENSDPYSPFNSDSWSYAEATGTSGLPPAFQKNFEGLWINSNKGAISKGRGYRRGADTDSDASSVGVLSQGTDEFPALKPRGRGFALRKVVNKPGANAN